MSRKKDKRQACCKLIRKYHSWEIRSLLQPCMWAYCKTCEMMCNVLLSPCYHSTSCQRHVQCNYTLSVMVNMSNRFHENIRDILQSAAIIKRIKLFSVASLRWFEICQVINNIWNIYKCVEILALVACFPETIHLLRLSHLHGLNSWTTNSITKWAMIFWRCQGNDGYVLLVQNQTYLYFFQSRSTTSSREISTGKFNMASLMKNEKNQDICCPMRYRKRFF